MGYLIARSPRGLAVWSTIVDGLISQDDLDVKGVLEVYRKADERSLELNRKYGWAKLSPKDLAERERQWWVEATKGLREKAEAIQAGHMEPEIDWDYVCRYARNGA